MCICVIESMQNVFVTVSHGKFKEAARDIKAV